MVLKKELKYPMSAASRTALITKEGNCRKEVNSGGRESGSMNKYMCVYMCHMCMCGVHMSMHRQVNFMYNVYVEK